MNKEKITETSLIMPITPEFIERRIQLVRGQKVLLDRDLAELYQVPTKVLNQAVQRNSNRFPGDFMFKLSSDEAINLKSQIVISSWGVSKGNRSQIVTGSDKHRNTRYQPYAFTELGVAMLSSVLKSDRAVQMNIFIMRAFVKLRELLATHKDLAEKIHVLENEQKEQGKDIAGISIAMSKLIKDNLEAKKKLPSAIGFRV